MDSSRGAVWRKWDLHVHLPFTKMANGYGTDVAVWDEFIDELENSDVSVIGITDYNSADNYFEFLRRYEKKYPNTKKVFFFNLELRLEASVNKAAEEVNVHIIFDDKIKNFETKIKNFLTRLETSIDRSGATLAFGDLTTDDDHKRACVKDHRKIRTDLKKTFGDQSPYVFIGSANNAGLRPDTESPRKRETTDSIDDVCHGFFGNNASREYYLKTDRYDAKGTALKKPVFGGSDAHSMTDLKAWLGKQAFTKDADGKEILKKNITWIKADNSFEGLRQVLNEPKSRVYLGEMPLKLIKVEENRTNYIKEIRIYNKLGDDKEWFNAAIPLNPGMVAIIGKKGSGKSALTDILALGGRSHAEQNKFSFLTKDKFLNQEVSDNFALNIEWQSGEKYTHDLSSVINPSSELERVKYLPQKFVESICNEYGVSSAFQKEINRVIFSYVPQEKKLGATNLADLINFKGQSIDIEVAGLEARLKDTNTKIVRCEENSQPEYSAQIVEKIEKKREEIKSLTKPEAVVKPKPDPSEEKDREAVEILNKKIVDLGTKITAFTTELGTVNEKIQKFNNVRQRINTFNDSLLQLSIDLRGDLKDLDIKIEDYVSVSIKEDELDQKKLKLTNRKSEIDLLLGNVEYPEPTNKGDVKLKSLVQQKEELVEERRTINAKLTDPARKYQKYLLDVAKYDALVLAIQGDKEEPAADTINYLLAEQNYIKKELPAELEQLYIDRRGFTKQIYEKKSSKMSFFEEIYKPLVELLSEERDSQEDAGSVLEFTVQPVFDKEQFINSFTRMVNFGKKGYFMGKDEGSLALKDIMRKYDTKTFKGLSGMINEVSNKLMKTEDGELLKVTSQLLVTPETFYNFLFSMGYVEVQFNLRFNGKDLNQNQFSPGEKGALLLIFYLLTEKSNIPLIIDQPEENLDNESVYKLLVPYIRNVSEHRQLIIVTHNPNLAVVCDAEQIVHAEMNKTTNKISYTYGSLETPDMNKRVSDVLEGTLPAFDIRNAVYSRTHLK